MSSKTFLKLAVSGLMLFLVFRAVDLGELLHTLANVPGRVVAVAVVGFTFSQMVSAFRWWLLARGGNISVSYWQALRAFFIGMYANCFGLGTLGGDLLKGALLVKGTGQKTQAIASAFADRALGLAVLSVIGVLAALLVSEHHMDDRLVLTLVAVGTVIIIGWVLGPFILLRVVPPGNRLRAKVEQVSVLFHQHPWTVVLAASVAVVFHLIQIAVQWVMALGLGADVGFGAMLATVPFVNIVSTLPVSWNGLGVREKAYILLFAPVVMTHEQAVTMGAIWLLAITVASAVGGVLAFLSGGIGRLSNSGVSPAETEAGSSAQEDSPEASALPR